jgi:ornithine cyclodeaminase/alanine dehydrogenase-like protein (mu-crystallin family)
MNEIIPPQSSRREFLITSTRFAAASALAGLTLPHVHAAGSDLIQVALVGCGGRGTGAAEQALNTKGGPIKLVAMADVYADKLNSSCENLKRQVGERMDVPPDRRFLGFDAYQKALDCLKPGDIAIFATPPAFRWVHFGYAIKKGLHVFMEKPVTVDAPTTKKMFALAEEADKKLERAIRKGDVRRYYNNDWIAEAEQKGVVTQEEARSLAELRDLVARVIAVDHFDAAEISGRKPAPPAAAGASTQSQDSIAAE